MDPACNSTFGVVTLFQLLFLNSRKLPVVANVTILNYDGSQFFDPGVTVSQPPKEKCFTISFTKKSSKCSYYCLNSSRPQFRNTLAYILNSQGARSIKDAVECAVEVVVQGFVEGEDTVNVADAGKIANVGTGEDVVEVKCADECADECAVEVKSAETGRDGVEVKVKVENMINAENADKVEVSNNKGSIDNVYGCCFLLQPSKKELQPW